MIKYEVRFLEPAKVFLDKLESKAREKILFNIWKSREITIRNCSRNFSEIYGNSGLTKGIQFRLFAFWDKSNTKTTLVIATHGSIKRTQKTPEKDVERAEKLRKDYFENK